MTIEELKKELKEMTNKANAAINGDLVTDEWIKENIKINEKAEDLFGIKSPVLAALKELQARRKADKEHWHINPSEDEKAPPEGRTGSERAILPIPCTVGFKNWTVTQWFQKINEELDELKVAVTEDLDNALNRSAAGLVPEDDMIWQDAIAEEAADVMTAITSMLEVIGIKERKRQEAQIFVNNKNRERGRIAE